VDTSSAGVRLSRWERLGIGLLLAGFLAFGVLVEVRSALLTRRMGDLSVYLRAAWSVRAGENCYDITDDNHWHYHYPPLFAILLMPLADPPAGADHSGMVPYAVSVAIFYLVNVLLLTLAVHWLASALEATSAHAEVRGQSTGSRRWWLLRLLPVIVCLPPIAHTLMRGQANLFVLALICGLIACLLRGQRLRAGLCLAGAVCLKVIPAFLLLVPLWRRDRRCLAGCALGLCLGLALVPSLVLGPFRAVKCYQDMAEKLFQPALTKGGDHARDVELLNVTATDSQSFLAMIHNTLYLDPPTRPRQADAMVRLAHWLIALTFTGLTLLAAHGRRDAGSPNTALFVGALTLIMILSSPVCHTHYFALAVPLVTGLIAASWERRHSGSPDGRGLGIGFVLLMALQFVGQTLPQIPECQLLRDTGFATYTALVLWLVGCVTMRRRPSPENGIIPLARAA
jgi:hypothetical protein